MTKPVLYPRAKLIKFSDDMLRRIDECRATIRPIPSESEVVRMLIEEALTARGFPGEEKTDESE